MKQMKKLLSVLLVLCMIFSLMCTALAAEGDEAPLKGKVVILHSNDVHGGFAKVEEGSDDILGLLGYAKIAALREEYVKQGAEVILADCGDFIQGSPYVSVSKGATAIEMMNAAGYDVVTLGNHEFDFGYENIVSILKDAKFKTVCGDVIKDGKSILDGWTILEKAGVKIGFVGLETPETYTKVNPGLIQGISFPQKDELYKCAQTLVDEVKAAGADLVIGLFHLGVDDESEPNRSADVYANVTGIDFILDGHSHSVMTPGDKGPFSDLPIQSTGTKFANIGVVVIDPAEKAVADSCLVATKDLADDAAVKAKAEEIMKQVDEQYGAVFAKSEVNLNGDRAPGNRNEETNNGDLITDAMIWTVQKDTELKVPAENVVAITNGGGIRAPIAKGDVTMKDVNTVLPFGNTVAVVYVTGAELLEALEASTYSTPGAVGGFPQVSGMKFTINIGMPYDQGEQYPDSTYYGPASIQRVTIDEVNGKAFDESATYAVVTNNFCAAGGDTYYAFKAASEQFDTSIPLDEALVNYITDELGGVIGEQYAEPQGRITMKGTAAERELREALLALAAALPDEEALTEESAKAVSDAIDAADKVYPNGDEAALQKALEDLQAAGRALEFKPTSFKDVKPDDWFKPAVDFAQAAGLVNGMGDNTFAPNVGMTRAMVVTVLYRMEGAPDVKGLECSFKDLKEDWYKDAVVWAANVGVTNGLDAETFAPDQTITRQEMATMILRYDTGSALPVPEKDKLDEIRGELAKRFSDSASVADWAAESVQLCAQAGVMVGDKAAEGAEVTTFRPLGTLNRAECAQVLFNYFHCGIDPLLGEEAPAELPAAA